MKNRFLIALVALFLQAFYANAAVYIDGFGYASRYKDGVFNNFVIGKEEIQTYRGGGFGASFGIAKKFEDVVYFGLEVTSLSIGNPTILDFLTFKFGFSAGDFSAYVLGGFAFFGIVEGGGLEYIVKKGGKETSSKSRAIAVFSEYKRYNHLFDDPTHVFKLGMRVYL